MGSDQRDGFQPVALSAVDAILARLQVPEVTLEKRLALAKMLDDETHLSQMVVASKKAMHLLDQIHIHLDPFPGQKIQIWKRGFIEIMQVHARGAKEILAAALPPLSGEQP